MTHNEAVSFIQNTVRASVPESWADLGCGNGTFTRALIDLLPQGSHVTAVDREQQRLHMAGVTFVKANFEKELFDINDTNFLELTIINKDKLGKDYRISGKTIGVVIRTK